MRRCVLGLLTLTVVVLAAGCSKKTRSPANCRPLSVTAGGTPIRDLGHGLARRNKQARDITLQIDLWNHDKVTCATFNAKRGRAVEPGEVSVRAFSGGDGMMGQGVGIGVHTQGGVDVELVGSAPTAIGDKVALCVDHASFKPIAGTYKDQDVEIDGLFEGTYCGELAY